MAIFNEGRHTAEFALSIDSISVDVGTLAAAQGKLAAGTVLALDGSNYVAADAADTAVAILYDNVDATLAVKATIVTRIAEVNGAALTGLVTAHRAQLAAKNIIVR